MKKKNYLHLNLPITITLLILFSFIITLIMFYLQPNEFDEVLYAFEKTNMLTFWVNYAHVSVMLYLLWLLTNNLMFSSGILSFVLFFLSLVNRYKINIRQDPLMPWDLMLGNEVAEILKSFETIFLVKTIALILVYLLFVVLTMFYIRNQKLKILPRIIGFIVLLIVAVINNDKNLSKEKIYHKLYVKGDIYNQVNQFNSKGFIYNFMFYLSRSGVKVPEGYNEDELKSAIKEYTEDIDSDLKKPNVILILSESFTDIADYEEFNFDDYSYPLSNFSKIKNEGIFGHIIVPGFAGGTADTEFDIFTGINSRNLKGVPYAYRLIGKKKSSLVSVFDSLGYSTLAIHPGEDWFYNRKNVYEYLGFEETFFIDTFNPDDKLEDYMSEEATFRKVREEFERHLKENPEKPLFTFCATIQNHGPYEKRYFAEKNFDTSLNLNDNEEDILANYFEGIKMCDEELAKLIDYYKNCEEPVVVAYYGDHMPFLGEEIFEKLIGKELSKEATEYYKTPYFIWANKEANISFENFKPQKTETISSFYLPAILTKVLGFENCYPYFKYLLALKDKYPIILDNHYYDLNYEEYDFLTNVPNELNIYKNWSYYNIFN